MVAIGNKDSLNNVFTKFTFSTSSVISFNYNAYSGNNLKIFGIYIKNETNLVAIFYDLNNGIILGNVDFQNYLFSFKQTLPSKIGSITRGIFTSDSEYYFGIE
jgi:hypothetical protein